MRTLLVGLVLVVVGCGDRKDVRPVAVEGSAKPVAVGADATPVDAAPIDAAARPVPLSGDNMIQIMSTSLKPTEGTFMVEQWRHEALGLVFMRGAGFVGDPKEFALDLVNAEVKMLVGAGYNPRVEQTFVTLSFILRTDTSVTGATHLVSAGDAVYDPREDKVNWRPVTAK